MKNAAKCDTYCELQIFVNHRIFERTLRPLVFQGACLFERHFLLKPLGLVVSDTLSRVNLKMLAIWLLLAEALVQSADTRRIRFYQLVVASVGRYYDSSTKVQTAWRTVFIKFDLKSGRITR